MNRTGAQFCTQCFRRDPEGTGAPTAYTAAPPPVAVGSFALQPAGVAVGYPPPPPMIPAQATRGPVKWRWRHLWRFGFVTWGLPGVLVGILGFDISLSDMIDRSMLINIVGYLLGALVLAAMVRKEQNGDWTTVGLGPFSVNELAYGAGFGLLLLAAFAPIGMMLNHGRFGLDPLVKLLVGGASGPGVVLVGIVVVIGAPILEEIYFRGLLYEKLSRTSRWVAIAVSTVLFTAAHGALLIPAIMLMGFALAFMRRTKTLWFTMGAHAAWNFVIIIVAVFTLFGSAITFASSDDAFSVDHPRTWETTKRARRVFGRSPELVLGSARGSFAMFTHGRAPYRSAEQTLTGLVDRINGSGASQGMDQTEIMPTDVDFAPIGAEGYEMGYVAPGLTPEQPFFSTIVVVQRAGERKALYAEFRCMRSACMDDVHDFEEMLASIQLGAASAR